MKEALASPKDAALKLALEALEDSEDHLAKPYSTDARRAITAIKEALAQDETSSSRGEQEPVAFLVDDDLYYPEEIDWETLQEQGHTVAALYTTPPASVNEAPQEQQSCDRRTWGKPWVSLTDEDKKQIAKEANYNWEMTTGEYAERIGRLTEAKLKEKNT